jgi:hypothetical protein
MRFDVVEERKCRGYGCVNFSVLEGIKKFVIRSVNPAFESQIEEFSFSSSQCLFIVSRRFSRI